MLYMFGEVLLQKRLFQHRKWKRASKGEIKLQVKLKIKHLKKKKKRITSLQQQKT